MRNKSTTTTFFILSFILFLSQARAQKNISKTLEYKERMEMEILKNNIKKAILFEGEDELIAKLILLPKEEMVADQVVNELTQRYPIEKEKIQAIIDSLREDGSWPNIEYTGQSNSDWQPARHIERISLLTQAYFRKSSPFYKSKDLKLAIHKSLGYWLEKKYVARNWWFNAIGVPKTLGPVFVLLEDEMSLKEKEGAIAVMAKSELKTTGQNKVWQAGNVLIRGLLESNYDLVKQSRDSIISEIVVERKSYGKFEGIREDYSYHQHGEQQQFGNYGAAYLSCMSFWVKVLSGTSFAVGQDQLNILSDLITKGFQRVLWNGYLDVNGLGRQFFHNTQQHKALAVAFAAKTLSDFDSQNKDKYLQLINENLYGAKHASELNGLYHFWKSDQTVYRTPNWMVSVRMSSPGTIGGEAGNGDNLKGYYMSDGATYVYIDGDEYNNIFPVWDWRKLPGITAFDSSKPFKKLNFAGYWSYSDFVGNVSDGTTGITTFQLKRDSLNANKSWIFTEDYILCLGAGIQSNCDSAVTSSIEQRLKSTDLLVYENRQWRKTDGLHTSKVSDVRFFHDKTGYIVIDAPALGANVEARTGSWHNIMSFYPPEMTSTKDVVSLWINHGVKPQESHYQYLVLPSSSPGKVSGFNLNSIQVIQNTKQVQSVFLVKENTVYIAAYETVTLELPYKSSFKCEPGLYLLKFDGKDKNPNILASDPTGQKDSLEVELNGTKQIIQQTKP